MHAVGEINLQTPTVPIVDHFIYRSGAEELTWISILVRASRVTNIGLQDMQVAWLVFVVGRAGMVNVGQFVECKLSVETGRNNLPNRSIVVVFQATHSCMARTIPVPIPQTAATRH